jgi:glycosyltransferase involved in cell wall biosynthesis
LHAIELASGSRENLWRREHQPDELITLHPGRATDDLEFLSVFKSVRRTLGTLNIEVCLLPSYSPKRSLAALMAAKSLGVRTVMMNESHAGTARATGVRHLVKRRLVRWFDSALVGGAPQRRYFAALGVPEEKIFEGYDAVDNDHFAARATEASARAELHAARLGLPRHYFLSLGRFIPKKNLPVLIQAFRQYLDSRPAKARDLVLVGAGEGESALRLLCAELALPVYDHGREAAKNGRTTSTAPTGVHFFGARQLEDIPVFYALASAFVLPSLHEEWGLVVNEAMACSLPVIVSRNAGCAEDLVKHGQNGFVFDPEDAAELAGCLGRFDDYQLARAMGRRSAEMIRGLDCRKFARSARQAIQAAMPNGG